MINLTHKTPIRAAAWGDIFYAEVFTLAGYCEGRGLDYAKELERAKSFGHELVSSTSSGSCLLGDREASKRKNDAARAIVAQAVTLKTGDHVRVDGIPHEVYFPQGNETGLAPRNSDPVHFKPLVAA